MMSLPQLSAMVLGHAYNVNDDARSYYYKPGSTDKDTIALDIKNTRDALDTLEQELQKIDIFAMDDVKLNDPEPVLCYVSGQWAFFTTQELSEQWGDDWGDVPFEHNAGEPYRYDEHDAKRGKRPWTITKLVFESSLESPNEWISNSSWSVQDINNKATPWLSSGKYGKRDKDGNPIEIWAGTTLSEFIRIVQGIGGAIYTRLPESEKEQQA